MQRRRRLVDVQPNHMLQRPRARGARAWPLSVHVRRREESGVFIEDLSPADAYCVRGPNVRAVGWLEAGHPHPQGPVPDEFLARLKEHVARAYQPIVFFGWHECSLCSDGQPRTGIFNLLIPTTCRLYFAPEMIVHYIEDHGYQPPMEFVDAVMACPDQESPRYMELLELFAGGWGLQ